MPFYPFRCDGCNHAEDRLLTVLKRNSRQACRACGAALVRTVSAPALGIWNASKSFPISGVSDGMTFPSKRAYESHLKAEGIAEFSTHAPAKTKPCTKRWVYGR